MSEISKEPTTREIMQELSYLRRDVSKLLENQRDTQRELGGNGGPGLRTRVTILERDVEELNASFSAHAVENEITSRRVERIYYVGGGIAMALLIFEVLRWIVPLFAP